MINRIKEIYHKLKILIQLWRNENFKKIKISKPETINLNANDICNSKCTMCNIWKQKKKFEIDYHDLKKIFNNSFYSEVKHVGITGGEPTLRPDLLELYKACIDFLPNLKGLSIITNAIKEVEVKEQIEKINTLCLSRNINFSVMVSLDGYGEMHDKIRGRKGNFETAISVLNYSKALNIPTSFGATISKENVWEIDELLDFAKQNNHYGRFRVAEFINRLYNNDRDQVIRNFNDEEKYHLVLFFEKLKISYEKDVTINRTYSSIQNILLGGKRLTGCPYQNNAILINSEGGLGFCAPKSKIIGNGLKRESSVLFSENLPEKKRIINTNCESCIHDYHAPITFKEQLKKELNQLKKRYLNIYSENKILKLSYFLSSPKIPNNSYSILIVGWYGTETVGDKAILAAIVIFYRNKYGKNLNIIIGSLYPFITDRSIVELGIEAKIVSTQTFEFLRYSKYCDEVIMGGGPLMDLDELYVPLLSFQVAKKFNKKRTIFGCGLGPIHESKYINSIQKILNLSTEIFLRDLDSKNILQHRFGIDNAVVIGDPAESFIEHINHKIITNKENVLSLFLRDWTYEYAKDIYSRDEFEVVKLRFEKGLANFIKFQMVKWKIEKVEFHHMHNFIIGNDDRDFSRRFIRQYFSNQNNIQYETKLSSVDSIVEVMKRSKLNICMRFHSVLFAHKLNVNYLPIDYTLGGKITGYLRQNNALEKIVTIQDLIENFSDETTSDKYS